MRCSSFMHYGVTPCRGKKERASGENRTTPCNQSHDQSHDDERRAITGHGCHFRFVYGICSEKCGRCERQGRAALTAALSGNEPMTGTRRTSGPNSFFSPVSADQLDGHRYLSPPFTPPYTQAHAQQARRATQLSHSPLCRPVAVVDHRAWNELMLQARRTLPRSARKQYYFCGTKAKRARNRKAARITKQASAQNSDNDSSSMLLSAEGPCV